MTETLRRRLAAGGTWALIGRSAMVLGSFTINILVVRLLPPDQVGIYFLLVSAVASAVVLGQFGLKKVAVRLISSHLATEQTSLAAQIALKCLKLGFVASLVVASLFSIGATSVFELLFDVNVSMGIITLGAIWVFFRAMKEIIGETFRGYQLIREASLFSGASEQLVYAFLLIVLLSGIVDPTLFSVTASGAIAAIISMMMAGRLLYVKMSPIPYATDKEPPRIVRMALPFFVSGTVLFIFAQIDIWTLGATQTKEEVAVYAAAKRLLFSIFIPLSIINDVLPPLISELFEKQQLEKLENMLRGVALMAAIPAMIILGVFVLAAESILGFVYGNYYRAGADVLIILSVGQAVNVLVGSCSNVLAMTGHQTLVMRVNLATGLLTVTGCIILAHVAGAIGVAVIIATTIAGQNLVMLVLAKRKTGVWSHAGKPALAVSALKQIYRRQMND